MTYKVVVHESEEGFSVSCPGLPGCWSQCAAEAEALENIQDAIREAGFEPQLRNQQYEWRDIPKTIEEQVVNY